MNMEFLHRNYVNTTTLVGVDSATSTAGFIFDRRPNRQYVSSGFDDDTTSTTLTITFTETQTVGHIVLQKTNLKGFTIYHGLTTTKTFALTTTSGTAASAWSGNSATGLYLVLASQTAITSLSIKCDSTIVANEEKKLGQLWVTRRAYQLDRNPDKGGYQPTVKAKQHNHELADGGTVSYRILDKMKVKLKLTHRDDRSTVETLYNLNHELAFAPFPTGTAWDGDLWEMVWTGGFDYRRPSENVLSSGFEADIELAETPSL